MRAQQARRIGSVAIATAIIASSFMVRVPVAHAEPAYGSATVQTVGWKKKYKKAYKKGWRGPYRPYTYYSPYRKNYWVGPAIGFGAGLIVGSILVAPPGYAAPSYRGTSTDAYCHKKYKSYNSRTKTYTGYDGKQHRCRIP